MIDSDLPVTTKQAMPFDSLLAQSRDLVCGRLAQAMAGMLDKVEETLSALAGETQDRDARALYLEARDKALAQRKSIEEMFRSQYLREFQVRSNRMKKIGQSFSDFDSSSLELDLVGEDDLNETLKANDMATKLRRYCDEELVALDQRVGVLLGDANLESEDNPFSPQAICDAFKQTCRNLVANVNVRMVLLKLFDDHVLDDIRSVYKAVNSLLVQNSILPKIRFGVSRAQEGSKAPSPGVREGEPPPGAVAHAADGAPGGEPDFFSVLQKLLASHAKAMTQPGAAGGTGASAQGLAAMAGFPPIPGMPGLMRADGTPLVVLQGAELMDFLTRVQHGEGKTLAEGGPSPVVRAGAPGTANVIRELKATSLGTGMNQMDTMTLDIVAMLFDQLFDDPKIPIAVKGIIGRMQIPILKVAIADKEFFSRKSHPARRMLDTLGEISLRLPADFNASNPLFGRLEAIIQDLINSFQDSMEVFDAVRERLQILTAEEDQRLEQETRSAAEQIEQKESLAVSKTMAEFEVKARAQAGEIPRLVLDFLVQEWVKVLLMLHAKHGQHSDPWKTALATMDLLIWSIKAKKTSEERSRLTAEAPMLLKRLVVGLKIAGVDDAVGAGFFSELNKLQADAMSTDAESEVAAGHDAGAAIDLANLDSAPALNPLPVPDVAIPWLPPDATKPVPAPGATTSLPALDAIKPVQAPDATISLPALDAIKPVPAPGATRLVPTPGVTRPVPAPGATKPVPTPEKVVKPIPTAARPRPAAAEPPKADSDSLDFTAVVTIKNPFGKGKVQVKELDFTDQGAASTTPATGGATDVEFIKNIKEGTWVEFREQGKEGTYRPAKLSYISPLRSSFLFVDRLGETVNECSRTELARLFRLGKVVVMDEVPLFDRMMNGVVGKLS